MKRREFLKKSFLTTTFLSCGGFSIASQGNEFKPREYWPKRDDNWKYMGKKDTSTVKREKEYTFDVAVIGGGVAGLCAAVSAARHGAKTVLVQNRPVLGGNASSEIHVPINGSYHFKNKFGVDRETGIVEEIQLENRYYNVQNSWEVWDHVMYDYVTRQENLTLMLNTQAMEAVMDGNSIKKAICFQFSTESKIIISADVFIDCSGDGALAASAGAEYRTGREGKAEFNEKYAPDEPDGWVMGDSIQFSSKDMGYPVPFNPPSFAIKYDPSKANKRNITQLSCGFWWVELGSDLDIVDVTEENRHKLLGYLYGAWDYVKNSGKFPEAANLVLDWVGSVPGRRESRRFMGDYILNENDLTKFTHFDDAIAYGGGWSLDEHCPGGILNDKEPASYFHQRFEKMFEIPYRCIYSKNIDNLMFAGRNVSVTHIALSATRLIAICGLVGQAAGTAAAMCMEYKTSPRGVYKKHIPELQERLLRDDCYIPNRPANDGADLARKAKIEASSTTSGNVALLTDGYSRDEVNRIHHWQSDGLNPDLILSWDKPVSLSSVEIKCDSNLHTEIQIHPNIEKRRKQRPGMPVELVKKVSVEAEVNGVWKELTEIDNNLHRLIKLNFSPVRTSRIRVNLKETYGASDVRLFEVRCY